MPNKKNALKSLRQTKKRTTARKQIETKLDVLLRQIKKLLATHAVENPIEIFRSLQKALDKASKKNIISVNRANRLKRRISKKLQGLIKK